MVSSLITADMLGKKVRITYRNGAKALFWVGFNEREGMLVKARETSTEGVPVPPDSELVSVALADGKPTKTVVEVAYSEEHPDQNIGAVLMELARDTAMYLDGKIEAGKGGVFGRVKFRDQYAARQFAAWAKKRFRGAGRGVASVKSYPFRPRPCHEREM